MGLLLSQGATEAAMSLENDGSLIPERDIGRTEHSSIVCID